jgi:hypothetical protein
MVQGTNGVLYGPAYTRQNTTNYEFYYSLSASGLTEKQYSFPPGGWGSAWQTLVVPPNQLFDIAVATPTSNSYINALAKIGEAGPISIVRQFTAAEGFPVGYNLALGDDGKIYGVGNTKADTSGTGFIFGFTTAGDYSYSKLVTFPSFPAHGEPLPLVAASDGNLYGTIGYGGANAKGSIYQATLSGDLHDVATFPATGMIRPASLMQAADGNLYGTTPTNYIFSYNLATKQLSTVYQMTPGGGQGQCPCQLIEGMDGNLYGITGAGGPAPGVGVIFSLDIGLPKPLPAISAAYPPSGAVGKQVILWGNYLLGATSVKFNGTPATYLGTSVRSLTATVPKGATTGPITVTTGNGSFTTTTNFTVQ